MGFHRGNRRNKLVKIIPMKLLFYDLETTGTDKEKHGIHQLSGYIVIDGSIVETFNFKVAPHKDAEYNPEALEIGRITREEVEAYPPMEAVFPQFIDMLDKYINKYDKKDKMFLVGFNNRHFDDQFLRKFFKRSGSKYFGSYFWSNSFDCLVLATPYLASKRYLMVDFKQSTVAKELGIQVEDEKLHDANYDIDLCIKIYDKVCGKY